MNSGVIEDAPQKVRPTALRKNHQTFEDERFAQPSDPFYEIFMEGLPRLHQKEIDMRLSSIKPN